MTTPTPSTARLLTPEQIALRAAGDPVPFLRLPEAATVFAERALRLRQLAAGHPMRDFLLFTAAIAEAQHTLLQQPRTLTLPDAAAVQAAIQAGRPTLDATARPREAVWREDLRALLALLEARPEAAPALAAVRRLAALDDEALEQQAGRLVGEALFGLDLAAAPLVAAGLQLYFTRAVLATAAAHAGARNAAFGRTANATRCPCCGSRPTASVLRIGADAEGYRYLSCSLCAAQWHMVRVKCSHCEGTKGISYRSLQPVEGHALPATGAAEGAVQAECCDECGHFLKLVNMAKDPHVDPAADDLASLTLDLLVDEEGFTRHGVNLMLLFGEAADSPSAGEA